MQLKVRTLLRVYNHRPQPERDLGCHVETLAETLSARSHYILTHPRLTSPQVRLALLVLMIIGFYSFNTHTG